MALQCFFETTSRITAQRQHYTKDLRKQKPLLHWQPSPFTTLAVLLPKCKTQTRHPAQHTVVSTCATFCRHLSVVSLSCVRIPRLAAFIFTAFVARLFSLHDNCWIVVFIHTQKRQCPLGLGKKRMYYLYFAAIGEELVKKAFIWEQKRNGDVITATAANGYG